MDDLHLLARLCAAIQCQDLNAMKDSLAAGADPNGHDVNSINQPPMNEAATRDFVPGLEVLHAAGGLIDSARDYSNTPLMTAAWNGRIEATRWLLRHGANISIAEPHGTALEIALYEGNQAMAEVILQERPELRVSALHTAVKGALLKLRDADMTQWLLSAGVSPNTTDLRGQSWLMVVQAHCDAYGHLSEMLLAAGADVNFQDANGKTALDRTVMYKSMPGFMRLLRAGANPDLTNDQGGTIRRLLERHPPYRRLKEALQAWEASSAAHRVITATPVPAGLARL